jgi:hypothetical protein
MVSVSVDPPTPPAFEVGVGVGEGEGGTEDGTNGGFALLELETVPDAGLRFDFGFGFEVVLAGLTLVLLFPLDGGTDAQRSFAAAAPPPAAAAACDNALRELSACGIDVSTSARRERRYTVLIMSAVDAVS